MDEAILLDFLYGLTIHSFKSIVCLHKSLLKLGRLLILLAGLASQQCFFPTVSIRMEN